MLLRETLERVAGEARAIVLTGEGRGFSSGVDLAAAAAGSGGFPEDTGEGLDLYFNPLVRTMVSLPVPLVAAVNGIAAGAGCSLALACDLIVAARSATFHMAFVGIGLVPDAGANWLLPRAIGRHRALEMMLLGQPVDAETGLAWGLANRVVDDADVAGEAQAIAARLAAGPTVALGLIRRLAVEASGSLEDALGAERRAQAVAGKTKDFRSAVMSFLSKQPPVFRGG